MDEMIGSRLFGNELIEDAFTHVSSYQCGNKKLIGTLYRTSEGIRFCVDDQVQVSINNTAIESVKRHSLSTVGASFIERLGCKALTFREVSSSKNFTFGLPDSAAKSWETHFNRFYDETRAKVTCVYD